MNILVVRFRQMGDAILTTVMLNTLRKSFPEARIDFVLNERIARLFEGHPSVGRIITFSDSERHSWLTYVRKVWQTVHQTRYDVIIDMRSTANTMLFALLSPSTPFRIGLRKHYTWLAFNHRVPACRGDESMVDHNLKMLAPLTSRYTLQYVRQFTLAPQTAEIAAFRQYMQQQGIDLDRPVMLAGVVTRVPSKSWSEDNMVWVLRQLMLAYPRLQVVLNYAPGAEEQSARRIYEQLGRPAQIFIDVQARSQRELVAMASLVTFYFGNEGGARHIVHAVGRPSIVICAPTSSRATWIPRDDTPADAIDPREMTDAEHYATLSYGQQFALVTKELVWQRLHDFIERYIAL